MLAESFARLKARRSLARRERRVTLDLLVTDPECY